LARATRKFSDLLGLAASESFATVAAMTRSQGIAALIGAAALLGIAIRFSHKEEAPTTPPAEQMPAQHHDAATTNLAPDGVFVGPGNVAYVNYGTRDPALQAFMQALMNGSFDSRAKGQSIFLKICAACHQPDGMGKDGVGPPLSGSEWVSAEKGDRLVRIVLNGLNGPIHVKDRDWNLVMPPWKESLKDEEIAIVLTYVRGQFGGTKAGAIKPETVSDARKESHPKPETAAELLALPTE
jgi:mono/diheme cytochrome c family protein